MTRSLLLAALAIPAFAADYAVDDDHSAALFRIQHMGAGMFWGTFQTVTGELSYDPANPAGNKVSISIKADSVSGGQADLEKHLKSNDFFDVKQFPTLTFVSKSFTRKADGQYDVAGDLTIHGVTKAVTVPVVRTGMSTHLMKKVPMIGFESVFEIDRNDFGLKYGAGAIGDKVRVTLAIEAISK